jgi:hypothetical protein
MRNIHDHKVNGLNEAIQIAVNDEPGPGGANHDYVFILNKTLPGTTAVEASGLRLNFQNGPIAESGVNGLSNEALVAVVIDRMRGFQFQRLPDGEFDESKRGIYACKENACALTHLEEALLWLQSRTHKRMARGVEGAMKV